MLGVYYHCKPQLVFKICRLGAVYGVVYAGDSLTAARALRDKAAKQIKLVRAGDCDKQVGVVNSRLLKDGVCSAVSRNAHNVVL